MATEKRLIDRNEIFPNRCFYVNAEDPMKSLDELINRINNAPTVDAVEVVRCKDCEYRHDSCFAGNGNIYCDYHHKYFGLDDFCSYGERKDNE
jgi:hypothetical protein